MPNVDRAPFNEVPKKWANDRELEPFIRKLLTIIWQLRNRTGGDGDYITEVQGDFVESESPLNYDIRDLQRDRDKYRAEAQTNRKLRSLESEIGSLKAQINTLERQNRAALAKLNQFIANMPTMKK